MSPDDVSMCDSMVPVPKGTSVMTWFILTEWAIGRTLPRYSSRMAWAASIHSSLRNGYVATSARYPESPQEFAVARLAVVGAAPPPRQGAVLFGLTPVGARSAGNLSRVPGASNRQSRIEERERNS